MSGRFVSQSIQMPIFTNSRSREKATESEEMDIDEKEMRAAEALCELSSSPISLLFHPSLPLKPAISPGSNANGSSLREVPSHMAHSNHTRVHTPLEPSSIGESIEIDTNCNGFIRPVNNANMGEVFQCTWPRCDWSCDSAADIEKHIRQDHQCGSDSEEELFYYTSKKMATDDDHSLTQAFTHLQASSPPQKLFVTPTRPVHDHNYLQQAAMHSASSAPQSIPIPRRPLHGPTHHSYQPDSSPLSPTSFSMSPQSRSWQHSSQVGAASPTTVLSASPGHKRSRSDVKKCRKVYGMERRDEWCTQCKWKKACTRFMD